MTELGLASPTSTAGRRTLAKKKQAMPGGRYPIPNVSFLKKAMRAIGRTPASKRPAVRAFIKRRASALGASNLLKSPAWSMSNEQLTGLTVIELTRMLDSDLQLAGAMPVSTPAASASDGPRVASLGLQPHQARAYARFRKRGVKHATAVKLAKRVESRANNMGSAAKVGTGTSSQAYARTGIAGTVSTPGTGQIGQGTKAKAKSGTSQRSSFIPLSSGRAPSSGGNAESRKGKRSIVRSAVPGLRQSSATPPGGKLLKASAGKYGNWPDYKGKSVVPATPVSTYPGKLPTNLKVNTLMDENANSVRVSGTNTQRPFRSASQARKAYNALRAKGITHGTAMKVVGQYYGSGRPSNKLGLNKGGSQTNLRMGRGASSRGPKVQ